MLFVLLLLRFFWLVACTKAAEGPSRETIKVATLNPEEFEQFKELLSSVYHQKEDDAKAKLRITKIPSEFLESPNMYEFVRDIGRMGPNLWPEIQVLLRTVSQKGNWNII